MSKIVRHCLGRVPGILLGGAIALGTAVEVGAAGEILVLDGNRGALKKSPRSALRGGSGERGARPRVGFRQSHPRAAAFWPHRPRARERGHGLGGGCRAGRYRRWLFRVDLGSGERTIVSDFRDDSQGPLVAHLSRLRWSLAEPPWSRMKAK